MIPSNAFTTSPDVGAFVAPENGTYNRLSQTVRGGVALNDPSQGRNLKNWVGFYETGDIKIKPEGGAVVFTLTQSGVLTISLAFDNNMAPVIAWTTSAGAKLYYFDTQTSAFITRDFPNITSCRVCVDNPLNFYLASSDVIFGYTLNGNLCYRQQRDRYDTERVIGASTNRLIRMGLSAKNRLQFELVDPSLA